MLTPWSKKRSDTPGFSNLKSSVCASCADTLWSKKKSTVMMMAGTMAAPICDPGARRDPRRLPGIRDGPRS